jgi:hypothetical protein
MLSLWILEGEMGIRLCLESRTRHQSGLFYTILGWGKLVSRKRDGRKVHKGQISHGRWSASLVAKYGQQGARRSDADTQ